MRRLAGAAVRRALPSGSLATSIGEGLRRPSLRSPVEPAELAGRGEARAAARRESGTDYDGPVPLSLLVGPANAGKVEQLLDRFRARDRTAAVPRRSQHRRHRARPARPAAALAVVALGPGGHLRRSLPRACREELVRTPARRQCAPSARSLAARRGEARFLCRLGPFRRRSSMHSWRASSSWSRL